MRRRSASSRSSEADLDITSFLSLMIILVPVLLVMLVFSRITVIDLTLPDLSANATTPDAAKQLEVVLQADAMRINYPAGTQLRRIDKRAGRHDFAQLSLMLREVKRQLRNQGIDKRDITILSQPHTAYQTLVTTMDTVRSFKAVVAANVVDAELFPVIALGDAPRPGALAGQ